MTLQLSIPGLSSRGCCDMPISPVSGRNTSTFFEWHQAQLISFPSCVEIHRSMMSGSSIRGISVGEIQGIPITLQHSCFILLAVEVFAVMWQYNEPVFTFLMFLLYGPVLLGTILIVSAFGVVVTDDAVAFYPNTHYSDLRSMNWDMRSRQSDWVSLTNLLVPIVIDTLK